MLDYKGGRGLKNLEKSDYVICERSLYKYLPNVNLKKVKVRGNAKSFTFV